MKQLRIAAVAAACLAATSFHAHVHAADLLSGFGGERGFGTEFVFPNDDSSTGLLNLPFSINFFGQAFDTFYVNNNGNITFAAPLSEYTPNPFPVANQPMLAPYWADVDTRNADVVNKVWYASPSSDTLVVTWDEVGYFSSHADKTNSFQLVLRKEGDNGDFNAEFRYQQLTWTTGDASGGAGGVGGTPAQAGWDAGDQVHFQTLPGSRTDAVLNLMNTSNVSDSTPGLWTFSFRSGSLPGQTPNNPILPIFVPPEPGIPVEPGWDFEFNVVSPDVPVFIDPEIAIGYEYELTSSGNAFTSVLLPSIGDGIFGIEVWDGAQWVVVGTAVAGTSFDLSSFGNVTRFRVNGIEVEAALDPEDPTAFVTGLTFGATGPVAVSQTPMTTMVPEPGTYALLLGGLLVVGLRTPFKRSIATRLA